jgi:hypothetical protein
MDDNNQEAGRGKLWQAKQPDALTDKFDKV